MVPLSFWMFFVPFPFGTDKVSFSLLPLFFLFFVSFFVALTKCPAYGTDKVSFSLLCPSFSGHAHAMT